jgi:hypothetical protein
MHLLAKPRTRKLDVDDPETTVRSLVLPVAIPALQKIEDSLGTAIRHVAVLAKIVLRKQPESPQSK